MTLLRVFFLTVFFAPLALAQTWSVQPTPTTNDLNDVFGVTDTEAYAVGEVGRLLRTTNGGQTWNQQILGNNDLEGVGFSPSGAVGIIATDAGPVYRSTNGVNWNLVGTGSNGNLRGVAWGTETVVWIAEREGAALRSTNAGLNWSSSATGAADRLRGIDAIGTNLAWVVGESGTIRFTANGGATWSSQPAGTGADLHAIQMLDASTGYIVGNNNVVLKTTNGGASWANVSNGNVGGDGLFFLDANTGWVVDNLGRIWFTANGGTSWAIQPSGTNANLSAVHFASPQRGWAVGDGGVVTSFTAPGGGGVTISVSPVNPPVVIPAGGGAFSFTATLSNTGATSQTFDAWAVATLPNGSMRTVFGPVSVTLGAGQSAMRTLTQNVPANAPSGFYTYTANVGTFPNAASDSDSFPVVKDGVAREAAVAEWSVSGWEDEVEAAARTAAEGFALSAAYPNPFTSRTQVTLDVAEPQRVTVAVFDALGRQVAVLHDGLLAADASHALTIEAADLPSGVYVVRATGESFVETRRVTLIR